MASELSEEHAVLAMLQRASATPAAASAHLRRSLEADVRDAAARIEAPTTVFHRLDHPFVPLRLGRDLARRIPGADLVELPGSRALFDESDRAEVVGRIAELVTGAPAPPLDDRRLAAVLFCDIVDSTNRSVSLGDAQWRRVLDEHDTTSRRIVERHAGRVVKFTGDGLLAVFDRPSRAVDAALDVRDALHDAGIAIRAGVHVGEIEVRGDDVTGISVHIAQRIQAAAEPGQVAVSRTVVDLVAGSALTAAEVGTFELKGLPGSWTLFAIGRR
jgi:class 3 adenylate cyclase